MEENQRKRYQEYVLENMADAVCVTDEHGNVQFSNPAAQRFLGIPSGEGKGKKIWEYIPFVKRNDELIQLFVDAVCSENPAAQVSIDYENREGRVFKCRASIKKGKRESKTFYIIVITDLTRLFKVSDAFSRYTSPDIAEYVLNTPEGSEPGGKEREASILMSDLRGFTALSQTLKPNELLYMLNHYLTEMVKVIESYRGTVIEFLGDGIFVVFGAPKEDPDHASHATACAIGMENAMSNINEWNRENGFPMLEMGIAVNSGTVVVGNIGSSQKMKYGCIGNAVNLAGRVEGLTVGGQIYITEYTRKRLSGNLKVRGMQRFLPKGNAVPVNIYDIRGLGEIKIEAKESPTLWKEIQNGPTVPVYELRGKVVGRAELTGKITALSEDHRFGKIRVNGKLEELENVMIGFGGDLYAKVIGIEDGETVLRFTSKPNKFEEKLEELVFQ